MLITAKRETAPMMNAGNDWFLKVLIKNITEFIRIDVWTLCRTCPPSWVRNLSPEMKQRERSTVREQTGKKDYENSRKSMQLCLNSLRCTGEMEVLRSLSNPEEMDDAELLKDLRGLGKPPSFDMKDTMLINTAVDTRDTTGDIQTSRRDTRMTPYEKIRGQKNTEKRFFHWLNKSSLTVLERE